MSAGGQAVELALALAQAPSMAERMRSTPLPADTILLIQIAAGEKDVCRDTARATGRPPEVIRAAAVLYLHQILFSPTSDSYRVLGVVPGASRQQMRRHMRLLLQWLHPDHNANEWESVFTERVVRAWREASRGATQARPPAHASQAVVHSRRARKPRQRWVALPLNNAEPRSRRPIEAVGKRRIAAVLVAALGLAIALLPTAPPLYRWFEAQQKGFGYWLE